MSPADLLALEDVSARAWPALRTARLGGWRLNASTGFTGRANTCWALEAPDGDWAGVSVMRTSPDFRRQGLAARVVSALLDVAAGQGATRSYLQVEVKNETAVALYGKLGFTTAYQYRYWAR